MDTTDPLGLAYADLLVGQYDCVDRIILNAYFPFACSPGGFRLWWRSLEGGDDTLDNAHLIRMAGRFSRCVRGWAKKENKSPARIHRTTPPPSSPPALPLPAPLMPVGATLWNL